MKVNRQVFYDLIKPEIFGGRLSAGQVAGMNAILDEWDKQGLTDLRWLAYMLATVYHETAHTMLPVPEIGRGRGKRYGRPDPNTGQTYYGRGLVQLTWATNYKKMEDILGVPLYLHPDLALRKDVAVKILFEGMMTGKSYRGDFTGKSLEDYFTATKTDWVNARRIVNGLDRATLIAGYARKFHNVLKRASTPLKSPQALKRSRTIHTAAATTTAGAADTGYNSYQIMDSLNSVQEHISTGQIIGVSVGIVMMCVGALVMYYRWDDAGRPSFREIIRGLD
jgi:putative chitinase